jgi:hypothetical protein
VTNFGATYKIIVNDKDAPPLNPDDFIGGYEFQFSSYANSGYPNTIILQNTNIQLKIELLVEWL